MIGHTDSSDISGNSVHSVLRDRAAPCFGCGGLCVLSPALNSQQSYTLFTRLGLEHLAIFMCNT